MGNLEQNEIREWISKLSECISGMEYFLKKLIEKDFKELNEKLNVKSITKEKKPVYTNKSLKEYLGVSEKTLKKYRDEGLIAYSQVYEKFWYTQKDVDDFLNKHKYDTF